jgi:hypothetical protein
VDVARGPVSIDRVAHIMRHVRDKGVTLWLENGQLRYKAPKGALSGTEIQRLRESKDQVISLLERSTLADSPVQPQRSARLHRAPVSYSQLAHWRLYRLWQRPAIRQIASATRLRGGLEAAILESAIRELAGRHDALRTRIVVQADLPVQIVDPPTRYSLPIEDLSGLGASQREHAVIEKLNSLILQPIDISVGPLFEALLLKLHRTEHVLLVAMEHTIADAFSMGIFLRELFTTYAQLIRGRPIELPALAVQFTDYAIWQERTAPAWIARHRSHWESLQAFPLVPFPHEEEYLLDSRTGWGAVPVRIGGALRNELSAWCRTHRTTLVMSAFAAYAALVMRWCNVHETIVQFQSDGRLQPGWENTIGYFAAPVYVTVELLEEDTFADLVTRVTAAYWRAQEHADSSYLESRTSRPDLVRCSGFNWIPRAHALGFPELEGSAEALECSSIEFAHPMVKSLQRDNDPAAVLYETDGGIAGDIYFPRYRFSGATMERFARNFHALIRILLSEPLKRLREVVVL